MVGMVVAMLGKVEHYQRVAGNFGRTGENRTRRPSLTELILGGRLEFAGCWEIVGYPVLQIFPDLTFIFYGQLRRKLAGSNTLTAGAADCDLFALDQTQTPKHLLISAYRTHCVC
jgi:hypothetical protein